MSKEMEFSEACDKLAEIIQANERGYIEVYGMMIASFVCACEEGETPRMALAIAKDSPNAADREMEQCGEES